MAQFTPAAGKTYTLQSSISSTQTTITLSSFKVPVSNANMTMALMDTTIAYGTISPRTSNSEFISFTGITQNSDGTATLTGVTRGLNKTAPLTENSSFKLPHAGGSQFILSDPPQVFNQYSVIANDETITGRKQFPTAGTASAAVVGASYVAPVQDNEIATKKYVDDTASFGAPLATISTPGLIVLGSATQIEAGVVLGASNAYIGLTNEQYGARKIIGYARTGGSANAYTMSATTAISGYATGQIVGFEASFTNTGNATINVSSLGAKNLFLGSTGLFPGVITTGTYVGAVYDGTQFEITETSNLISASSTANTVALRDNVGDVIVPTTPTSSTAAASKAYVDTIGTKISVVTTDVTYSSSTAENTIATTSIAGGILSTNNAVRFTMHISALGVTGTNTWTLRFKYGGTTIATKTYTNVSGNNSFAGKVEFILAGAGTTSSQNVSYSLNLGTPNYIGNGNLQGMMFSESAQGTSAIDSTTAQNLVVTSQHSNSSVNDNITVSMIVVEKITG